MIYIWCCSMHMMLLMLADDDDDDGVYMQVLERGAKHKQMMRCLFFICCLMTEDVQNL